jgi:small subunit ribosomal protein S8
MDPVADMLTVIKNAQAVSKEGAKVGFSKLKFEIAKVLEKEGFIKAVEKKGRKTKKSIEISLKYEEDGTPVIADFKKISKPGQRIYYSAREIRPVRSGYGIAIISTSKGIMTDEEARKNKIGGEVICLVW